MFDAQYAGILRPKELEIRRVNTLVDWLRTAHGNNLISLDPRMQAIIFGATNRVTTYDQYICNGYRWHTFDYGQGRKTMCSGVLIPASGVVYYGMLREIVVVSFYGLGLPHQSICLFKCDWYDPNRGVKTCPKYGFVDIDSKKIWNTQEKFILASQAQQVYYTPYAVSFVAGRKARRKGIWAAIPARPRHFIDYSSITTEQERDDFFEDPHPPPVTQVVDDLTDFNMRGELAEQSNIHVDIDPEISDEEIESEDEED